MTPAQHEIYTGFTYTAAGLIHDAIDLDSLERMDEPVSIFDIDTLHEGLLFLQAQVPADIIEDIVAKFNQLLRWYSVPFGGVRRCLNRSRKGQTRSHAVVVRLKEMLDEKAQDPLTTTKPEKFPNALMETRLLLMLKNKFDISWVFRSFLMAGNCRRRFFVACLRVNYLLRRIPNRLRRYGLHTTKTVVYEYQCRQTPITTGDPYCVWRIVPRTTTHHTLFVNSYYIIFTILYKDISNWILTWRTHIEIFIIRIKTPLCYVSSHII